MSHRIEPWLGRSKILGLFAAVLLAIAAASGYGETIFLKDGSTIKGTITRLVNDTLYVETSFGSRIGIPKDKVARIEFIPAPQLSTPHHPTQAEQVDAPAGSLRVAFGKMSFSSKVIVKRDREREAYERANSIEMLLLVDGALVFSTVDSTTDKVVRNGPETTLKNNFNPGDIRVALAPGSYHCRIIIRTPPGSTHQDSFDDGPLDVEASTRDIGISSRTWTTIEVGKRKKKLGLGGSELYIR